MNVQTLLRMLLQKKTPRYDPETDYMADLKLIIWALNPVRVKQKHPQRRCRVCMKKKVWKETRVYCKECNTPLCKTPCFSDYHTKKCLLQDWKRRSKTNFNRFWWFFLFVSDLNNQFSHCYYLLLNFRLFRVADSLNTGLTVKQCRNSDFLITVCMYNERIRSVLMLNQRHFIVN